MLEVQHRVASIAKTLNSANIPCVLWGGALMKVHAIPCADSDIHFIVPDVQYDAAVEALSARADLLLCFPEPPDDDEECPFFKPWSIGGTFHLHTDDYKRAVGLDKQSDILGFLHPFRWGTSAPPTKADLCRHFILATDDDVIRPWELYQRGGAFTKDPQDHPVVIPTAAVMLEAFIRLSVESDDLTQGGIYSLRFLLYVWEHIDDAGYLHAEQMPDLMRTMWVLFKGGIPAKVWAKRLDDGLAAEEESKALVTRRTECQN